MGRSGPAPGRRSAAPWKWLLEIVAVSAIAFGSYELGKRAAPASPPVSSARTAPVPPPTERPHETAVAAPILRETAAPAAAPFQQALPTPPREVIAASPSPEPTAQPPEAEAAAAPETPRQKMARCLSFLVENDEIHLSGYSPLATPVKVTATNNCPFSFEGPDVSVEVRAIPLYAEGTMARAVGRFQDPISSHGRSETQMLLPCARCDEVTHRYEARLAP